MIIELSDKTCPRCGKHLQADTGVHSWLVWCRGCRNSIDSRVRLRATLEMGRGETLEQALVDFRKVMKVCGIEVVDDG